MLKSAMVAGALMALLLLTACSGRGATDRPVKPTVDNPADTRAIARVIEKRLEKRPPLRVVVTCPTEVEWRAGATFTCLVKDPDGRSRATVTLGTAKDDAGGPSAGSGRTAQGEYSWTLR